MSQLMCFRTSVDTQHIYVMEWSRAEILKAEEAQTESLHSTALPRCLQPALMFLQGFRGVSEQTSVMSPCLSMAQGCSCLVVVVYESCAVISFSPPGLFRTTSMNPAKMAPSPTFAVDNPSSHPKRQVKEK